MFNFYVVNKNVKAESRAFYVHLDSDAVFFSVEDICTFETIAAEAVKNGYPVLLMPGADISCPQEESNALRDFAPSVNLNKVEIPF